MNVPQQTDETETTQQTTKEPTASPFTGLVAVGQMFPLNGVWCRVAKFEGPHIILVATEYTTKIKRYINNTLRDRNID